MKYKHVYISIFFKFKKKYYTRLKTYAIFRVTCTDIFCTMDSIFQMSI